MNAEYRKIEKETEKALLIDFKAISTGTWNGVKPVWVPKSQIEIISETLLHLPAWLLNRIESENQMRISAESI
jgi:hypothetical protein